MNARATPFTTQPGRLFDSIENAERAIECFPNLFPAGYRYEVEVVRKTTNGGRKFLMEMAAVVARDDDGNFVGYGRNPEG
jgi:ribosomal protein S5